MRKSEEQLSSRRSFLKASFIAGIAPQFIPSSVLGLGDQVAPSNKITIGVLGSGAQGRRDMVNFLGLKDVRVTALCDVNELNIRKALESVTEAYGKSDVSIVSDYQELTEDSSIDAILMALPAHWHSIPSLDAILQGKHIYHEKPMGMSFVEAKRVRKAVLKKGVVFQFGTQQRSDLKFRWACELALNGRLGKLKEIHVMVPGGITAEHFPEQPVPAYVDWDKWIGPAPATSFHEKKLQRNFHENMTHFSLGMISCWGIHHLDIANWVNSQYAEGPSRVTGRGDFPNAGSCDAVLNWDVEFEYDSAPTIKFKGPPESGQHRVVFVGESKTISVTRGKLDAETEMLRDPQNGVGSMTKKLPVSANHAQNFIEAIKSGGRAICDIETAVQSDMLCQIAHIAVKTGRKLQWNSENERFIKDKGANDLLEPREFRGDWKLPKV